MDNPFSDLRQAYQEFTSERAIELKERRDNSTRLKVYTQTDTSMIGPMFWHICNMSKSYNEIPARGTYARAEWLDNLWKSEPILAGAIYSMVAKMQSMSWKVEGGRNGAKQSAEMLSRARYMGGMDWSGFIGTTSIDFYAQDNGVWWDAIRNSYPYGPLVDLAHIDTRCCMATGNAAKPMYYRSSLVNDDHWYSPGEFIHFCSMPSPDQRELGLGFCALSRAARAAKLLIALYDYDAEKLSNLPPEGIASVTGLTEREFRQAIAIWQAERLKNNSLTFPQVLWLIGNNPGAKVSVDIASFSSLPESFDRQTVVSQYVNTLALDFGVDTREFWAISTGALGTASEAEVQHLKARGKGGGEFISLVERHLNAELPEGVVFAFDTQDIEEDAVAAGVAKAWIEAYVQLVFPKNPEHEPIMDADTFKRILADKGVLPEWALDDGRVTISSDQVHKDNLEALVKFVWKMGRLNCHTILDMTRRSLNPPPLETIDGQVIKQEDLSVLPSIKGKPIQDTEVERGARVTRAAVESEMEIWGQIPELSPYVPASFKEAAVVNADQ